MSTRIHLGIPSCSSLHQAHLTRIQHQLSALEQEREARHVLEMFNEALSDWTEKVLSKLKCMDPSASST